MRLSSAALGQAAAETGFNPEPLEKVARLLDLLEGIQSHPFLKGRLVLKGGTALNLFYLDVPRLSVDIDLNYIGGVDRKKREEMVTRFQEGEGPPVMVVSVKAGGTGINLTRASQVVHVDRWWNPAVEAQATDRAHRIGQKRTVVVQTLVTAGTLEERIDRMLEEKKELAEVALSGGERWLTELDDDALRELVALDVDEADSDAVDQRTYPQ